MDYKHMCIGIAVVLVSCTNASKKADNAALSEGPFQNDVKFLKKYIDVIVLEDSSGKGKVAISPALQGRVMTSSANSDQGNSYGWINKSLFESGDRSNHINAFGGEERFWLGPEGGQFSIFFEKGKEFSLDNWFTPKLMDLEPFDLVSATKSEAIFTKQAELKNYSGTRFKIKIDREIKVLNPRAVYSQLGIKEEAEAHLVAFQTHNSVQNIGEESWSKKSGLLSIWLLGMLNPTPNTVIIIPFRKGPDDELGAIVNDDYFGKVPGDRLVVGDGVIYFKGDGEYRSKIGLSPLRATNVLGSYDYANHTLTVVMFDKPDGVTDYVNSAWKIQENPFGGDVINSYNDGSPSPGVKPLGRFNELESSSPALELKVGQKITHNQTTIHFQGNEEMMNRLTKSILGVSVFQIKGAFPIK